MENFEAVLSVPHLSRTEKWERDFLNLLPQQSAKLISDTPKSGPDGWPYLLVQTTPKNGEPLEQIFSWLADRGVGLVVNPTEEGADYVLTFGMIWSFVHRGNFLPQDKSAYKSENTDPYSSVNVTHKQQYHVGQPSEGFLPGQVRHLVWQFFQDQKVSDPKILMISEDGKNFDLAFSLESLNNPPEKEWNGILEALSWFFPLDYRLALISEKVFPQFEPLHIEQ